MVWDNSDPNATEGVIEYDGLEERRPFRAARLVDDSERFLFLYFPRKSKAKAIEKFLLEKVDQGIKLDKEMYVDSHDDIRVL